jgi:hypothetical protein
MNYHVMRPGWGEDVLCEPHALATLPPSANGDLTRLYDGDYIVCDIEWCNRCYACAETAKSER